MDKKRKAGRMAKINGPETGCICKMRQLNILVCELCFLSIFLVFSPALTVFFLCCSLPCTCAAPPLVVYPPVPPQVYSHHFQSPGHLPRPARPLCSSFFTNTPWTQEALNQIPLRCFPLFHQPSTPAPRLPLQVAA